MHTFKAILLVGTAALALTACSSNRGPGEIGSRDDIIIRNMGDDKTPTPPAPVSAPKISEIQEAAPSEAEPEMAEEQVVDVEQEFPAALSAEDAVDVREQVIPRELQAVPEVGPEDSSEAARPMETVTMEAPSSVAVPSVPAPSAPASPESVPDASGLVDLSDISMASLPTKTPQEIMEVQEALKEQGFYEGEPDGKVDAKTLNSLVRYKASKGALPKEEKPSPAPLPVSQETEEKSPVSAVLSASQPVAVPTPTIFKVGAVSMSDPALIRAVQAVLATKGFYDGPVTGKMDTALLNALSRYQSVNVLAPGGLNEETLKSLGVME